MNRKVYFAGSIRGGRNDAALYQTFIREINKTDQVLTEHVGDLSRSVREGTRNQDREIYEQDTAWLRACDVVIAECTHPSLGVGYELAYAERYDKPVHILYRPQETSLSAMLKGNPRFVLHPYRKEAEGLEILHEILQGL